MNQVLSKYLATLLVLCLATATLAHASDSTDDLSDKSDQKLTDLLLSSHDPRTQVSCLYRLGLRYRNPNEPMINVGIPVGEPRAKRTPLPDGLLEKATALAEEEGDTNVRLSAIAALVRFKYHTDTSPTMESLLTNDCSLVRIRAAQALIEFEQYYHQRISAGVIPALIQSLGPTNNPQYQWQAAETLGYLGPRAEAALPALRQFQQQASPQLRVYADTAIKSIEKHPKRNKKP